MFHKFFHWGYAAQAYSMNHTGIIKIHQPKCIAWWREEILNIPSVSSRHAQALIGVPRHNLFYLTIDIYQY
jgi:hypothetical protein